MGNSYSENRICRCQTRSTRADNVVSNAETKLEDKNISSKKEDIRKREVIASDTANLFKTDTRDQNKLKPQEKTGAGDGDFGLKKRVDAVGNNRREAEPSQSPVLSPSQSQSRLDSSFVLSDLTDRMKNLSTGGDNLEDIPKVHYYGWFFSPEASSDINAVVMHFYRSCLEVSHFDRFMRNCCKEADVRDPLEYYAFKRPGKRIKPDDELEYHVTAKFLGGVRDPEYQTMVHPFINKSFYIHLVGIVFTPRTLGVRVKLTSAQQLMFDEKDEQRNGRKLSIGGTSTSANVTVRVQQIVNEELENYSVMKKMHKSNPKCKYKKDASKITFRSLKNYCDTSSTSFLSNSMTNSRAHITIACAPKVIPKRTGDDLVEIIDLEQRPSSTSCNFQHDYEINNGVLRQFGRLPEAFVLYPDMEMIVPAIFNCI